MPEQDIIWTGEDKEIEYALTSNNIPLDLGTLTNMLIILYLKEDKEPVERYSLVATTGYNNTDVVMINPVTGSFYVRLQAEKTRGLREDLLMTEVKVRYANVSYSGNNYDSIQSDVVVAQMRESQSGDEDAF